MRVFLVHCHGFEIECTSLQEARDLQAGYAHRWHIEVRQ